MIRMRTEKEIQEEEERYLATLTGADYFAMVNIIDAQRESRNKNQRSNGDTVFAGLAIIGALLITILTALGVI